MNKSKEEKKAEQYYQKVLKYVENNKTGKKTTYSNELEKVCRELFGVKFKGVFASDKIPRLTSLAPYCILNLDRTGEPGSHWVALAKCKDGAMLYDSFGRDDTVIIKNLRFSGNGKIIDSDKKDVEQKTKETNCGARCIAWLLVFNDLGEEYAQLI
jgi:hypothetical protein